jgi:hypothetical protein
MWCGGRWAGGPGACPSTAGIGAASAATLEDSSLFGAVTACAGAAKGRR